MSTTVDFLIRLQTANPLSRSPRWAGDIVAVRVRPHLGFGRDEGLPTYGVLTVTDIAADTAKMRCVRNYSEPDPDYPEKDLFTCRASHWINLDNLLPAQKEALTKTGQLVMGCAEFITRCNNRIQSLQQAYAISP